MLRPAAVLVLALTPAATAPVEVVTLPTRLLARARGVGVYEGGFGSDLCPHPRDEGLFYFMTDRGPNFGTGKEDEKVFVLPAWAPRIGLFARRGRAFRRIDTIVLRDEQGRPMVGIPNPAGQGGTGEAAFDLRGRRLEPNAAGVDPEGLAALADGTFWVAEEYGPSLVHVDSRGRTLERVSPHKRGRQGQSLPRVLAARRPNYGFEGLTATADGRMLATVLQAPLDNPGPQVRETARLTRIVTYEPETGRTRQFAYLHDAPGLFNTAIAIVSPEEFLIVERDGGFQGDARKPARHKRVYRAWIEGATDLSDSEDGARGRLFGGRTPEEMSDVERDTAGIRAVRRELLVDLLALPGGYPHDKPEGIALVGDRTLAIVNDDDFGVTDDGGRLTPKGLRAERGARDRSRVLFVPLAAPLR